MTKNGGSYQRVRTKAAKRKGNAAEQRKRKTKAKDDGKEKR